MKKTVIITNIANHYMINLAESFIRYVGEENVHFIVTEKIPKDRIKLGFDAELQELGYVISANERADEARQLVLQADIVIGSYYANDLLRARVCKGKKTYIYSERIFKENGKSAISWFRNIGRQIKYRFLLSKNRYYDENVFFLCIGIYAEEDYLCIGVKKNHIHPFAYFSAKSEYSEREYETSESIEFVWVGRLLGWKRPDQAIRLIRRLMEDGYSVHLSIVGEGSENKNLREMAEGVPVTFCGAIPTNNVRDFLRNADIFLFTSSYREGWGVVLNEAMSEGTAVIASNQAGATTYLLKDEVNGLSYDGSDEELYSCAERYLKDPELIRKYGQAARKTMEREWNAEFFVKKLLSC